MEDPAAEIRGVVRSLSESIYGKTVAENVEKYFTNDAFVLHPFINQPSLVRGREGVKGIYKFFRVVTIHNAITFHAVMFNENKTQGAIELTERFQLRLIPPPFRITFSCHFIIRVDLRLEKDGRYRIWRQDDNVINDLHRSGLGIFLPGSSFISDIIKGVTGFILIIIGRFLLATGWIWP
ncbi:hypothetical protein O181_074668 [Austropuccinia psidii MF-1]|uniref:SigF-like NTF2-like domain-containing protein n=1 Tax=Austropuccinia psidii MF-1 TaxID=1389203 RepID=A0A9Q3IB62_9BASI|nr:hypothetical protein [Austropuccinia psidii MF-1]